MANTETIRIRWVRSGIAFNRKQKEIVRSLGLRHLHQQVERPDSPAMRGLISKVAHLVEVVNGDKAPSKSSVPEYTISQPALEAAKLRPEATSEPPSESGQVPSGSNL